MLSRIGQKKEYESIMVLLQFITSLMLSKTGQKKEYESIMVLLQFIT